MTTVDHGEQSVLTVLTTGGSPSMRCSIRVAMANNPATAGIASSAMTNIIALPLRIAFDKNGYRPGRRGS
jgi:hypothetical protein